MIELKRLKLINWHNFENVTFDCARLTYMIGVNAVGKTTILDAIRYCLTTNRNFNALGNKKSGRTLQGSVHAKQRGENAYRRPGHTVAYIGAEFWNSVKRTSFVIAVRVESEGPMQELHPGDQTWYLSEEGCTLEMLPFLDPCTGAPSTKEAFKPSVGRLSYTRSPSEARDRICRALGIGRASSPLGKKFNEVFQMGTSMDEIPNFREFLYQYIPLTTKKNSATRWSCSTARTSPPRCGSVPKRRAAASWCSMSSRPTGIMPATAPAGVRRSENTVSARPCMPSFGRGTRIFLLGVKRICIALLLWKLHKASDTFCSRTPGFLGYMGRTEL